MSSESESAVPVAGRIDRWSRGAKIFDALGIHPGLLNPRLCAPLLSLAIAVTASAVIIDSGDGTGNVTAPSPDPGWGNVGTLSGGAETVTYLENGWVLTAHHVGAADVWFNAVTYPWLPGTAVQLHNPDSSLADLVIFRLAQPYPPLSSLPIAATTPALGTSLILIGNGPDRGSATTWMLHAGYNWVVPSQTIRWGTNSITDPKGLSNYSSALAAYVFYTTFDQSGPGHSTDESQAGIGDSGGPVFAGSDLAGIMLAVDLYSSEPPNMSLYGQVTYIADLSVYRDQIVSLPEPVGGLWAGAALVVALRRRSAMTLASATEVALT